jgi:hypothetical protein
LYFYYKKVVIHSVFNRQIVTEEDWRSELLRFPNIDVLERNLNQLINIDKSNFSIEEVRKLYFKKAVIQPFSYREYVCEFLNKIPIWRARCRIDELCEDTSNPKTFSYPPITCCQANGRANLKGKAVFYSAHNDSTAIFEAKPRDGDVVYLTKWESKCNRNLRVGCYLATSIPTTNPWYLAAQEQYQYFLKRVGIYGKEKSEHIEMIFNFISNIFRTEQPPYVLTSWLANEALYGLSGIDMIVYPSILRQGQSCNIVIKPSFVDEYLTIQRVYKVQIADANPELIKHETLSIGELVNGHIIWRSPTHLDQVNLSGHNWIPS